MNGVPGMRVWVSRRCVIGAALLFAFIAVPPGMRASAGQPMSAEAFMTAFGDKAVRVLADSSLGENGRGEAVRDLFLGNFDVDAIGKFVLARHWRKATAVERQEFLDLFKKYVVITYGRRLSAYSGEKFAVDRSLDRGRGRHVVASRIERPYGPPVRVDWRVRSKPDGGWVITDAVIEGVSMTITQRNEFGAVIRNSGGEVEGLLAKLRELTGSGREQSADRQTRKDAL